MPWIPSYTEVDLRRAVAQAESWADLLHALGLRYHGKSIVTARRWASIWGISVQHLPASTPTQQRRLRYSDAVLRDVVARSSSWSAVLRELGYCPTGGNWKTVKRKCAEHAISTDHFDPHAANRIARRKTRIPLSEVLVEHSTYSRNSLKTRLYEAGLKERRCEQCGQGEEWKSRRMSLILDHVNGVRDDNRLPNLQIVCPNCAASLDTHCGRKNRRPPVTARCGVCQVEFTVRYPGHRFCSVQCGARGRNHGQRHASRKVARPPREQLIAEITTLGYCTTGRKYGVSDNAIRKWMRAYERESRKPAVSPAGL